MIVLAAMAGLAAHAAVRPKVARLPFGPALAGAAWIVGLAAEGSWLTT
jgi:prepilin signal peptidase PulO-like enzyme (type II secretory pathway)